MQSSHLPSSPIARVEKCREWGGAYVWAARNPFQWFLSKRGTGYRERASRERSQRVGAPAVPLTFVLLSSDYCLQVPASGCHQLLTGANSSFPHCPLVGGLAFPPLGKAAPASDSLHLNPGDDFCISGWALSWFVFVFFFVSSVQT